MRTMFIALVMSVVYTMHIYFLGILSEKEKSILNGLYKCL